MCDAGWFTSEGENVFLVSKSILMEYIVLSHVLHFVHEQQLFVYFFLQTALYTVYIML